MFGRVLWAATGLVVLLVAAGCGAPPADGVTVPTAGPTTTSAVITTAPTTAIPPSGTGTAATNTTATSVIPGSTSTTAGPGTPSSTTTSTTGAVDHCPGGADPQCGASTAAGAAYLAAEVRGGTFGFWVVRLGGGAVASLNPDQGFYPASSIKVLQHLHAVRWAAAQPDPAAALATPIPVYDDPCAGAGPSHLEPLADVLEAMMVASDNQRASAVQDYFGRAAINATAVQVVGTSDTLLAHRFGCGGPANNPANRTTARDLSLIYERIGLGEILSPAGVDLFTGLMLGPLWPSLDAVVADEGRAGGLGAAAVQGFLEGVGLTYKAGWWGTNLSIGGLLTLPAACRDGSPRRYAFAVFVDGAAAVADGFQVGDVVPIVLRQEIGSALADYADCPG